MAAEPIDRRTGFPHPHQGVGLLCPVQLKTIKGRARLVNPDPTNACAVSQVMVASTTRYPLETEKFRLEATGLEHVRFLDKM